MENQQEPVDMRITYAATRTDLAKERNVLALDRTFLAWIKTGLAGLGGGIAIIRFLTFNNATHQFLAQLVGVVLVLWSIAIFVLSIISYRRYHQNLKVIEGAAGSTWTVTLLILTLIVLSIVLIAISLRDYSLIHFNL